MLSISKLSITLILLSMLSLGTQSIYAQEVSPGFSDLVPYVPTPQKVVDAMMELADIKEGDVLYDLGSGDGRIPIEAARRYGIQATGVEIDADLVKRAKAMARAKGVEDLVTFVQGDLFELDFSDATVLVLYLFPDLNLKLKPKIQQLPKGTRVISHRFDMGDWKPDQTRHVKLEDGSEHVVYYWTVR